MLRNNIFILVTLPCIFNEKEDVQKRTKMDRAVCVLLSGGQTLVYQMHTTPHLLEWRRGQCPTNETACVDGAHVAEQARYVQDEMKRRLN